MPQFEDASETVQAAIQQFMASDTGHSTTLPLRLRLLPEFLQEAQTQLNPSDMQKVCEQCILVLEQFYAHLPFKRARYAVDPVQQLRLLRSRLMDVNSSPQNDLQFHCEMLKIFASLRDAHTSYHLPPPYAGTTAFLPFSVQAYFDDKGAQRFVVTALLKGFVHPTFGIGAEVLEWNGMPIATAIDMTADQFPGGNAAAHFRRGLLHLSVRPLGSTLPPAEREVFVRYRPASDAAVSAPQDRIIALPWYAGINLVPPIEEDMGDSVYEALREYNMADQFLCYPHGGKPSTSDVAAPAPANPVLRSELPDIFEIQHAAGLMEPDASEVDPQLLAAHGKRFGYLRIKTFEAQPDDIAREFGRLLGIMNQAAPDGIIVDVRNNAGGSIRGAERLLQMLTPVRITPALFQFGNTTALQDILTQLRRLRTERSLSLETRHKLDGVTPFFHDWFDSIADGAANGGLLTPGRHITNPDEANDTGQVYYGPVVLVVDAASYSATDTFAAGFQDHSIGDVIGADGNTGGGGATRWLYNEELVKRIGGLVNIEPPLLSLPLGASVSFALQRSARTGLKAGEAVEDVGVRCSSTYRTTRNDLLKGSSDLVAFACGLLANKEKHSFDADAPRLTAGGVAVNLRCKAIDRVVCYLDDHPQMALAGEPQLSITVPVAGFDVENPPEVLRIEGYAWTGSGKQRSLDLVAAARRNIPTPARTGEPAAASAG